jgi:hypothetical protein
MEQRALLLVQANLGIALLLNCHQPQLLLPLLLLLLPPLLLLLVLLPGQATAAAAAAGGVAAGVGAVSVRPRLASRGGPKKSPWKAHCHLISPLLGLHNPLLLLLLQLPPLLLPLLLLLCLWRLLWQQQWASWQQE